ncbi:MAG: stage III sporulation protein AE [Oscillospiraceae bacterium]|nr:stage III sporulation protein AE [Oscillospiraceae bacterium]
MKTILIPLFIILFYMFAVNAGAEEPANNYGQDDLIRTLPEDVREALDEKDITPDNAGALSITPFTVLKGTWNVFTEEFGKPLKMLASLVGVILLCAVVEVLRDGSGANGTSSSAGDTFGIVGVLAGAGMMCLYISDCVIRSVQTLNAGSVFLFTFVPIFAGIMAIAGQLTTASVFAAVLVGAGQVFAYITTAFLAPLASCILGVSVAGAVNPDLKIERLAETVKKIVIWALGLLITVFVGLLSLQSFLSTAADTVALRAVKFTVSSTVPIVGGAVGDALSAVRGSINILRGSTGTFGIIAGIAIIAPTLISAFCYKIALGIAAAVCDIFGISRLSALLKSGENVVTIIFAMLFCFTLLLVVSVGLMLFIWNGGA